MNLLFIYSTLMYSEDTLKINLSKPILIFKIIIPESFLIIWKIELIFAIDNYYLDYVILNNDK